VWTGRRPAADATLALIGLEEFRGDVSYVAGAPLPHVRGRWIAPDDPAVIDALAVAGCVICIDPSDPSDAVAFARRDLPVVAPVTSAAYEFVDGIVSWDAANGTTVSIAAAFAMGRVAHGTLDDRPAQPPAPSLAAYADRLPLVTVLTATYNRRSFLRRMLTCLAAQTYPNIESLIVNDAGEPVEDIVAEFPFARLINAPVNGGTYFRTARLGLREARGEYLAMLPDDDWFYPDHIERLMIAILRTGATVAHSFAVMRFLRTEPDGTEVTFGINPQSYASSVTPTIALQGTPIALPQCIQRRDTFDPDDVGWPLTDAVGSDQEYHMRLLKRHQLVAVDRFTSEFRDHAANSGKAHNWAEAMRYIYDEVQPVRAGSITALYREQALERLRAVRPGENVAEPVIRFHVG
jgi:glycosyltransferase involved in cell wall biosynthesis